MGCMNLLIHARHKHLIVFSMALAFFLMSSSTPSQFLAQGRQLFPPNSEMGEKIRSLIGSRPPKCENRCRSCGHCEAVQVPIIPAAAIKFLNSGKKKKNPRNSIQYSRGDDVSSYKPMCWKCKCGNLFFNP